MHTANATPDFHITHEMANFMLANPGCDRADLRREFSTRQIDKYAGEARTLAERRSVRRVA
ncbi:hypothetical protein ASC97_04130 [Rhizobium sp. Root1203]|nr:hypothetical protein ASC97_04130 [Rhizobium sp. Root1203]